jgi:hypothetical protein
MTSYKDHVPLGGSAVANLFEFVKFIWLEITLITSFWSFVYIEMTISST